MSNQSFMYNSNSTSGNPRIEMIFNVNKPTFIRSAGLTEDIIIYQMVGDCPSCKPDDVLWSPLIECGEVVMLSNLNNSVMIAVPGKYSLGDPNDGPLTLAGDVNITKQMGVDPSLLGKCSGVIETVVTNTCDEPVFVEMCNQVPIETSMAQLGCIVEDGEQIGVVMVCKVVSEIDGSVTTTKIAEFEDGTNVQDYSGPWQVCAPDVCQTETFIGVITDLSVLSN